MQKKKKRIFAVLLSAILVVALTGCSKLGSIINEIHGSLIGNNYTVYTYDNYGNQTLKTSGKKISITGNKIETVSYDSDGRAVTGYDLSSVITITIDGKEIESCGDTCVFVQKGLEPVRLEFLPYPHLMPTLFNGCGFGPPLSFTTTSTWTWIDHPVSGLRTLT